MTCKHERPNGTWFPELRLIPWNRKLTNKEIKTATHIGYLPQQPTGQFICRLCHTRVDEYIIAY
jgi:hypothetical protein